MAKGWESGFVLPPDIKKAFEAQISFPTEEKLFAALTNSTRVFSTNFDSAERCANIICDFLHQENRQNVPFGFSSWQKFSEITIQNIGNAEAEKLVLQLAPYTDGIALINYDGEIKVVNVGGSLELNSLRPNETISVDIWSESGAISWSQGSVSYATGTAKLEHPTELFGIGASIGNFVSFLFENPLLFVLLAIVGLAGFLKIALTLAELLGYEDCSDKNKDTSFRFEAKDAARHGDTLKYEGDKEWENIGYWYSTNDYVTWKFSITRPTRFIVIIEQSCIKWKYYRVSTEKQGRSGLDLEANGCTSPRRKLRNIGKTKESGVALLRLRLDQADCQGRLKLGM